MGSTCISEGGDARIHVCKTLALFGIVAFYLLGVVWGNGGSKPCGRYLHVQQKVEDRRCETEVAGVLTWS